MGVVEKLIYTCDHCGAHKEESIALPPNGIAANPCLPDGWYYGVGIGLVCPRHKVEIEVRDIDGNETENAYQEKDGPKDGADTTT